ncbi:MAG TPA: protein kinase [Pyrinomonadaceae bacterium]|nr:protein kinase [Pyrinomonadaceae bacterium]
MTPERRKQITRILERALELAPSERSAYLEVACADDAALRGLVESFISSYDGAGGVDDNDSRTMNVEGGGTLEIVPGATTLGSYRILEKLGEGGMGAVYLAKDARLGRRVAVKLLPAHFAGDDERVRRFEQEARAASALNHPNILTVHEIGESQGRRFIVTEFVEGRTLRERLAEGRFTLAEALDVCAQVAGALAKAHSSGIVHRDIKPENVMVDGDGHVKVLDFGIAKQIARAHGIDTEAPTNAQVNTASGVVLGTSTYMSPEQLRGLELDARTDIWSLGVMLYEMLAGRAPFGAKTYGDLVVAILHGEPPPLSDFCADSCAELDDIVCRALAKEREARWASAKEFQNELRWLRRRIDFNAETVRDDRAPSSVMPLSDTRRRAASQARQQTTEQRRQLTVLFADLAGVVALTEGEDAEDVSELMSSLWPLVDEAVESNGGALDKRVGETLVALWGAREAREDDPERAVRAALAMQTAVAEFVAETLPHATGALDEPSRDDEPGRLMRVGVSTGLVLLGEVGATGEITVTGDAVRLASRLLQIAPVGSVLVSHDTYRHIRGVFSVHPPETLPSAGRSEPVQFYRVKRAKPRAFRVQTRGVEGVETRMVGREGEFRRLTNSLEAVFEERELRIVTVTGDAGLGKSRLLYEFSNWIELLPETCYIFNGRAGASTQGLPYSLVRDVFSFRFEIQDSDPPQVAREKLERGMLAMCGATPEEEVLLRAHFVGQLIGFDFSASRYLSGILDDARQIRDRAFRYASQFFADIARQYPVAIYLDDIHWADDGSLDFFDYLARDCAQVPLLILCLARPMLLERRHAWGEGREHHERIALQPLSKKESRQLVEEILRRVRGVPPQLREMVVGGAEGNPFYVEELIKMLIDQRVIVPGAVEWSVDATRLGAVNVPPTLTGVLQARLDRLTPNEKAILQRASVIGRVFWDGAVEHLGSAQTGANTRASRTSAAASDASFVAGVVVGDTLEALRRKELIYRREASAFAGTREYTFKHALLRDVTYESVLKRERREYHRRAAKWLARRSGGRVGEYAGLIAEHYERAQAVEDAAEWYGRAGRQARETYAPETAINFYRKALDFLSTAERSGGADALALHTLRMEWYEGLGETLRVQARYADAVEAYQAMHSSADALNLPAAQAHAWNEIALVRASQMDTHAAFDSARRAELLSRQAGKSVAARVEITQALNLQSQASTRLGDTRAALRLADRALALTSDLGEPGRRVRAESLKSLGMAYHALGKFEKADEFKAQSLATYRELDDLLKVGNLLNSLGETARLRGDYAAAFARYQEALAIAREIGNRNGEILYLANLGGARAGLGDYIEAESDLRQTIEMATAAGYIGLSENYRFLAEALLGQGKIAEASDAARRALELGREIENQEHVAEAWRVLGIIASRGGSPVAVGEDSFDAAACFAESLAVFEHIQMEAERARTLRDWARHELARGDGGRGKELWREALEGFERLDMKLEVERMKAEA